MFSSDEDVRRRLFLVREAAKFTQQEAAAEIGVTRQKLSRWERGEGSPSLEELRAMCILYGVTPSYILFGVDLAQQIAGVMRKAAARTED